MEPRIRTLPPLQAACTAPRGATCLLQVILDQSTRIVRTPHETLDVARTPP